MSKQINKCLLAQLTGLVSLIVGQSGLTDKLLEVSENLKNRILLFE